MEKIFFSCGEDALSYINERYNGYTVKDAVCSDTTKFDRSYFDEPWSGECSAFEVLDDDANSVALFGYWEIGCNYVAKRNGEVIATSHSCVEIRKAVKAAYDIARANAAGALGDDDLAAQFTVTMAYDGVDEVSEVDWM